MGSSGRRATNIHLESGVVYLKISRFGLEIRDDKVCLGIYSSPDGDHSSNLELETTIIVCIISSDAQTFRLADLFPCVSFLPFFQFSYLPKCPLVLKYTGCQYCTRRPSESLVATVRLYVDSTDKTVIFSGSRFYR